MRGERKWKKNQEGEKDDHNITCLVFKNVVEGGEIKT
jgi:hypothetical protein